MEISYTPCRAILVGRCRHEVPGPLSLRDNAISWPTYCVRIAATFDIPRSSIYPGSRIIDSQGLLSARISHVPGKTSRVASAGWLDPFKQIFVAECRRCNGILSAIAINRDITPQVVKFSRNCANSRRQSSLDFSRCKTCFDRSSFEIDATSDQRQSSFDKFRLRSPRCAKLTLLTRVLSAAVDYRNLQLIFPVHLPSECNNDIECA